MGVAGSPIQSRVRLKRSIEIFPASDGSIYLLRMGAGEDMVLEDPSPADRVILATLAEGWSDRTRLRAALVHAGLDPGVASGSLEALSDLELVETDRGGLLDADALERFDRQLIYFADLATGSLTAEHLQVRLLESTVVLVGCGGLGTWAAAALAGAGVGRLVLVDDDEVDLSNLNRQMLFTEDQVGELKTVSARRNLKARFSALEVETHNRRIHGPADVKEVIAGADLVVATADWPPHLLPRWINEACIDAGVPHISAGQFPPKLRVGPLVVPGTTGCLACLEEAARRSYPLYDELVDFRAERTAVDASSGPVSGVIGTLLANEAVSFLTGARTPASLGVALLLDLERFSLTRDRVERWPDCPVCGQ